MSGVANSKLFGPSDVSDTKPAAEEKPKALPKLLTRDEKKARQITKITGKNRKRGAYVSERQLLRLQAAASNAFNAFRPA